MTPNSRTTLFRGKREKNRFLDSVQRVSTCACLEDVVMLNRREGVGTAMYATRAPLGIDKLREWKRVT